MDKISKRENLSSSPTARFILFIAEAMIWSCVYYANDKLSCCQMFALNRTNGLKQWTYAVVDVT